jgi:hypothetical protein
MFDSGARFAPSATRLDLRPRPADGEGRQISGDTPMPQKDMRLIAKPPEGSVVLEPAAGTSAMTGDGDTTYRCGGCKTRLLSNVSHNDVFHGEPFDAVKCPKCGKFNVVPPEDHHHHH